MEDNSFQKMTQKHEFVHLNTYTGASSLLGIPPSLIDPTVRDRVRDLWVSTLEKENEDGDRRMFSA